MVNQERELFEAIKKDDVKSFSLLVNSNNNLNLSFGRFPILSLCYLYSSFKILEKFEQQLFLIHNFNHVYEPFEVYKEYRHRAKKSLRLFASDDEIVYPILMLAVIDDRYALSRKYAKLYKTPEIIEKINKIYQINQEIKISVDENNIVLPKKKLNLKQKIYVSLVAVILSLFIVFSSVSLAVVGSSAGFGTRMLPIKISNEQQLKKVIASNDDRYYKLTSNIELTSEIEPKDFNGVIFGDNHTIFASNYIKNAFFNNLSGAIYDTNFVVNYDEMEITKNFSVIANKVSGLISNCVISGKINAKVNGEADVFVGLATAQNSGIIYETKADIQVQIVNANSHNAYLSLVGVNNAGGEIEKSGTIAGSKIVSNTVDISGVVCNNFGLVTMCENLASLEQTSAEEWHPNVAGIAILNKGTISNCENKGVLSSTSTVVRDPNDESNAKYYVFVGGIACENYGLIESSKNYGKIFGSSKDSFVYAAGICAMNEAEKDSKSTINDCLSKCDIEAESSNSEVYTGGVAAFNGSYWEEFENPFLHIIERYMVTLSKIDNSGFEGNIKTNCSKAYSGGLVGYCVYAEVKNSYSKLAFENKFVAGEGATSTAVVGGVIGVTNYIEYLGSNYYVKTGTMVAMYAPVTGGFQALSDNACGSTAVASISEIPEGVLKND